MPQACIQSTHTPWQPHCTAWPLGHLPATLQCRPTPRPGITLLVSELQAPGPHCTHHQPASRRAASQWPFVCEPALAPAPRQTQLSATTPSPVRSEPQAWGDASFLGILWGTLRFLVTYSCILLCHSLRILSIKLLILHR